MESVIVEEVLKKKELPKLSVILPVFNGEKYVERTISNLLKSTYQNIELIIIDDGSKDKSLEICKRYSNLDTRVKVYHKENEGVALARNYGLKYATGEYVGFCDQDDEISNKMYQQMMERILMDGSNAALCGTYRKKQNGESVVFEKFRDKIYDKNDIEEKLLLPMLFKGFAEYNNKEMWVKDILSEMETDDVQKIADIIVQEAVDNNLGRPKDDMTVIVAKIIKK